MAKKSAGTPVVGRGVGYIIGAESHPGHDPKPPTERQMTRDHAKRSMRRATEDWVDGRITTEEHKAVHSRGQHVLSGKQPGAFKGKSGERKMKY